MTATAAARILSDWSRRLEARTGYRVVANESAETNRRLGVTNGTRTVYAADWLWATAPAASLAGLRRILSARI